MCGCLPSSSDIASARKTFGLLLAEVERLRAYTKSLLDDGDDKLAEVARLRKVADAAIAWRDTWRHRRPFGDEDKAVALVDAVDVFEGRATERMP